MLVVNAALTAARKERARGARAKRIHTKLNRKIPSKTKLGIMVLKRQIRTDGMHTSYKPTRPSNPHLKPSILSFTMKRIHPSATISLHKSNERMRKPD